MDISKCIYCLEQKPISEFNCEHVIPRMMGTYEPTSLVLNHNEVCSECNSYFSRILESPLSLDSMESLYRIQHLRKPISNDHHLGKIHLRFIGHEGIFKGLRFNAKSDLRFPERMRLEIVDAIGIIDDEEKDEYRYFSIDDLCECTLEMQKNMLSAKRPLVFFGYDEEDVLYALSTHGFYIDNLKMKIQKSVQEMTDLKTLSIHIKVQIDNIMYRLAAKTIFNFLCLSYGKEYVLGHQFDHFRKFVRYNYTSDKIKAFINNGGIFGLPHLDENCHTVSTAWSRISDRIYLCGFISWFGQLTYTFTIQPWVTEVVNVLNLSKTAICNNTSYNIQVITDHMLYFDWPGFEGQLATPDVIF
jgi:hypothetical protein